MQRRQPPMRLCLGCGQKRQKRELLRLVRTPDGDVRIDPTGKQNGRGAYICHDPSCLEKAVRTQRLGRALELSLPDETLQALEEQIGARS